MELLGGGYGGLVSVDWDSTWRWNGDGWMNSDGMKSWYLRVDSLRRMGEYCSSPERNASKIKTKKANKQDLQVSLRKRIK